MQENSEANIFKATAALSFFPFFLFFLLVHTSCLPSHHQHLFALLLLILRFPLLLKSQHI